MNSLHLSFKKFSAESEMQKFRRAVFQQFTTYAVHVIHLHFTTCFAAIIIFRFDVTSVRIRPDFLIHQKVNLYYWVILEKEYVSTSNTSR